MVLAGPAIVTPKRKSTVAKKLEPASAVARKAKPCNDNRPDAVSHNKPAAIVRPAKPSRAGDNPKPAIVAPTRPKRGAAEAPHLPMELPLSRKPVERAGGDYKAMKAAMAGRLRKRP